MATTILDRNILKDHPSIAAAQVHAKPGEGGIKATVVVYGYRNSLSPKNLSEIMKQAEAGTESEDFEHKTEKIDDIRPEEEREALEEAAVDDVAGGPGLDEKGGEE